MYCFGDTANALLRARAELQTAQDRAAMLDQELKLSREQAQASRSEIQEINRDAHAWRR